MPDVQKIENLEVDEILYTDTYFDDIVGALIGRQLSSVAGQVDYNWDNNSITFNPGGSVAVTSDCVIWSLQKPHKAKTASSFKLHIHWEQPSSSTYQLTVQHRIQQNGAAKNATWVTTPVDITAGGVFPYVSGTLNQISPLVTIDLSTAGLSSTVQFRVARTDAIVGDIEATFLDCHAEFDAPGSRQEYIK